ncbi:Tfp pilus assembly protein PilV [Delftia tsuruhatensis]|uniref:type IV pilus modification protein PilV n=1 Tax=Delftia tsuruhatensis TaxID=180282 RepID=UPI001E6A4D2E|nr:type IV pilus modification protein PilV [Delftia tsuruhatensis]CAB5695000.1 Tfp pilus assembly protein PilV [Delftia tsuruhatensis]CAC9687034.1 Tfp pilus assembly protein PilV [Delftia tsuruhatensis]
MLTPSKGTPMQVHSWSGRQSGVGLVEVLVAVLLVAVGLLGAVRVHMRSIEFTVDTERRQMASMLATELLETMRGDTAKVLNAKGLPVDQLAGYEKVAGSALPAAPATCLPLPVEPSQRLACWGERARQLVPELTADRITDSFTVNADASGVVTVTVAWPVKKGQCLDGTDNEFCAFTLRSRL